MNWNTQTVHDSFVRSFVRMTDETVCQRNHPQCPQHHVFTHSFPVDDTKRLFFKRRFFKNKEGEREMIRSDLFRFGLDEEKKIFVFEMKLKLTARRDETTRRRYRSFHSRLS